jgi:hypothetical protein
MSNSARPEQTAENGDVLDAKPACMALVPLIPPTQWPNIPGGLPSRPNSTFVTHLIATAAQVPQTRVLRRATPADAQTAYRATQHQTQGTGIRPRHII